MRSFQGRFYGSWKQTILWVKGIEWDVVVGQKKKRTVLMGGGGGVTEKHGHLDGSQKQRLHVSKEQEGTFSWVRKKLTNEQTKNLSFS